MVYIAYFTELNLQICDYSPKRHICREICKYAFDENFHGHFCPRRKAAKFCHPGGDKDLDQKNLCWLLRRSDDYADKLSSCVQHAGLAAHQALMYRRAIKLFEGKTDTSTTINFCISSLYGVPWGHERGYSGPSRTSQVVPGCPPSLLELTIEALRLPMAKNLFDSSLPDSGPSFYKELELFISVRNMD